MQVKYVLLNDKQKYASILATLMWLDIHHFVYMLQLPVRQNVPYARPRPTPLRGRAQ